MWSLVSYREQDSRKEGVGALREDGSVVRVEALDGGGSLLDAVRRWPDVRQQLEGWDPAQAEVVTGATLLAPLRYPSKLICAGANYGEHLTEMGAEGVPGDWQPFFFLLPATTTIIGPEEPVKIPSGDARPDWEAELAVVIGRAAHNLTAAEAVEHVAGYTVLNDVTARGRHKRKASIAPPFDFDWLASKGIDTFTPMGPGIVPAWLVPDPHNLRIRLWLNGELKQDGNTSDMISNVWELIAAASAMTTLEPGDVLATGTPAGVGVVKGETLKVGDHMRIVIDGVGELINHVESDGEVIK